MKQIHLVTILSIILFGCASPTIPRQTVTKLKTGNSWPDHRFTTVKAYTYDYSADKTFDIVVSGRLNKSATPRSGIRLNQNQIDRLLADVRNSHSGHKRAYCFSPHHGFVFYDKHSRIVASLSVCFKCGNYTSDPNGTSQTWNLDDIRKIFEELEIQP